MAHTPLAERLRPESLSEVAGQHHLLDEGRVFRRTIDSGRIPNMIFYGPSGVGKTTVARILAQNSNMALHQLNGTSASTADIRSVVSAVGSFGTQNGVLLYLDEIQYLNKKQQQSLLEYIEDGSITLIASTTENPYFYVYNALLSRCTVFEFKPLTVEDAIDGLEKAAKRIETLDGVKIHFEEGALRRLASACGGDMRKALNSLEFAISAAPAVDGAKTLTADEVAQVAQRSAMRYDREGDEHYDILSAFQKSMRGSDPDAALHYLGRLLEAGDLASACRRLLVTVVEDVGLAYPQAIPIVKSCVDIALQVGMPEACLALSDGVVLTALAPKSNSAHDAYGAMMHDLKRGEAGGIPRQLQNKHFDGEDAEVKGQNYLYPHMYPDHWVPQQYLPDTLKNAHYYDFGDNKTEQSFRQYWEQVKKRHSQT